MVGSTLCDMLAQSGYLVRAALRADRLLPSSISEKVVVGDSTATTDWRDALRGVDCVVHAAARVHVLHDSPESSALYLETNAHGTYRLAAEAASAEVRRIVFLSSIKVNGEGATGHSYKSSDPACPQDAYGVSKLLGEQRLMEVARMTGLEAVLVRPPLVYGPRVKANFLRLMRWIDNERPLPLGSIQNSRSLVSVWNLCDFLIEALQNPAAPGRVWMVSDGEDLSTPDLIRRIATAIDRRARLLPVPVQLLQMCGALVGRRAELARLCGSLTVDITQTRDDLRWSPPVTVDESLTRTVRWYLSESRKT